VIPPPFPLQLALDHAMRRLRYVRGVVFIFLKQTSLTNYNYNCDKTQRSNPATFKINDVVIGVTSADPLAALGTHETSKKIQRMQRLSEHLLNQQSYYPLFPSGPVSTDLGQMHKFRMPVTPDILLVPSKLSYFAKDVGGSVVINSCSLSKGTTGGTFASISIKPVPRETVEGAADLKKAREVNKRTVVEVKRI